MTRYPVTGSTGRLGRLVSARLLDLDVDPASIVAVTIADGTGTSIAYRDLAPAAPRNFLVDSGLDPAHAAFAVEIEEGNARGTPTPALTSVVDAAVSRRFSESRRP